MKTLPPPSRHQRGAALIAALIILLMVTLIGTAGMEDTISENRMTLNFRDRRMAIAAADSGIRAAELWLKRMTVEPDLATQAGCAGQLPMCGMTSGYPIWNIAGPAMSGNNWRDAPWTFWTSLGVPFKGMSTQTNSTLGSNYADQPRTVIHKRDLPANLNPESGSLGGGWNYYYVISSGTGFRSDARAVVMTTFQKWM